MWCCFIIYYHNCPCYSTNAILITDDVTATSMYYYNNTSGLIAMIAIINLPLLGTQYILRTSIQGCLFTIISLFCTWWSKLQKHYMSVTHRISTTMTQTVKQNVCVVKYSRRSTFEFTCKGSKAFLRQRLYGIRKTAQTYEELSFSPKGTQQHYSKSLQTL